ncbi:MAG: cobyric acid synthase, partial [Anaerolineae bacterium]
LDQEEQALVHGFVVNKFRGDPRLFDDGITILEERSGKRVLGVMPWLKDLYLPEEDGVALDNLSVQKDGDIDIAVIRLPRISNFDDFDPLEKEPNVRVRYVQKAEDLGQPDAIILPGTKTTVPDMAWLWESGLALKIQELEKQGTAVVGICGGYQMLGKMIYDPDLIESDRPEVAGLAVFDYDTTFVGEKATYRSKAKITGGIGWLAGLEGSMIEGYEIHMGRTGSESAWLQFAERGDASVSLPDGSMDAAGRVWGCYMHGLFENDDLRRAWLGSLGLVEPGVNLPSLDESLERLADELEANLNLSGLG